MSIADTATVYTVPVDVPVIVSRAGIEDGVVAVGTVVRELDGNPVGPAADVGGG